MDRTKPDGKDGVISEKSDGALEETLPSGDFGPSSLTRDTVSPRGRADTDVVLERGAAIGRYVVIDHLGSGAMGVVMLAFDPTLDRKVAIKLVRLDHTGTTAGLQRLLREAQAMARLSHPNVVTVFEVGTFEERVFLAMEYVPGSTLGDWLDHHKRSRREILTAFLAAGQGLAAAHRAGIVHRDFKPANVLVSQDGRVRVADFGLATASLGRAPTPPPIEIAEPDSKELSMTKTGAVLGTPAYMSPEQHRGEPADARADQYAFCVALYEALYGELPFEGKTYVTYAENVLAGKLRDARRGSDVPARLRRALVRGLALDAKDRFPDLEPLLAELARDPAARRARIAIAAGGVGLVATVVALLARGTVADDPCATADQPLVGLWTAADRGALERSFGASGNPGASNAFDRVARAIDHRVQALRTARREACLATSVRHEQSEALLDRRIQCVDARASELAAMIGILSDHPDRATVDQSVDAVVSSPSVETCADRIALLADTVPPPAGARDEIAQLERQLDRAQALNRAGKWTESLAVTAKILPAANRIGYASLRARVHLLAAETHGQLAEIQQSIAELLAAGEAAAVAHDDRLLARAWIARYARIGHSLTRFDEARSLEPSVVAAVLRAGNDAELHGLYENARGVVDLAAGAYPAAAEHCLAAARELGQALGADDPRVANALGNAGTALINAGRYDEARAALERALAIRVEVLGSEHPSVSYAHFHLGDLYDTMGHPAKALTEFQRAADIDLKALPPDSPHIATDYVSLGVVLDELDRPKEALDYQERALAILKLHPNDDQKQFRNALLDIAGTYRALERLKDALAAYRQALELAEAAVGPDHPEVASILNNMAFVTIMGGDLVAGKAQLDRALAIREAKLGPAHPDVAKTLGMLASVAELRHDLREAIRLMSRAITILDPAHGPKVPLLFEFLDERGRKHFELHDYADAAADLARARDGYLANHLVYESDGARRALVDALWAQGGDHRRAAVAEMNTLIDGLKSGHKQDPKDLEDDRAWLAHHVAP